MSRDSLATVSRPLGLRAIGCVLLGVVVGLVGTGVHRLNPPVGLVLAYLAVASAAILVRAWAGSRGLVVLAGSLLVTVLAMSVFTPGDDVIVVRDGVGYAWLGGAVIVALVGTLPRRLFSDRPFGRAPTPGGHP